MHFKWNDNILDLKTRIEIQLVYHVNLLIQEKDQISITKPQIVVPINQSPTPILYPSSKQGESEKWSLSTGLIVTHPQPAPNLKMCHIYSHALWLFLEKPPPQLNLPREMCPKTIDKPTHTNTHRCRGDLRLSLAGSQSSWCGSSWLALVRAAAAPWEMRLEPLWQQHCC